MLLMVWGSVNVSLKRKGSEAKEKKLAIIELAYYLN
jgi:hypothetical protein